ncbi:MAG: NADP-dependent malic enzyme, partial [Gammaproteobacteria bacterium]|nr:NADP-dependent malic enzyme [Gammaproteobacteria bacterium]
EINEAMKIACVRAIADLAMAESSELVAKAYGKTPARFGPEYLIPKPFDPRLIVEIAPAVARAAMESGAATRPIDDLRAYKQSLNEFVYRSGLVMKPVIDRARQTPKRIVFAEGEDRRVLRAAQTAIDDGLARPILVGRAHVIRDRIRELGLRMTPDQDVEVCNILRDSRYSEYWRLYHRIMGRNGVTHDIAKKVARSENTVVSALMLRRGEADAMICGSVGHYSSHLEHISHIIGKAPGVLTFSALTALILPSGPLFICDTHVTEVPSAEDLAEMAILAAREVESFGLTPKIALVSRSNFGSNVSESSLRMREAVRLLHQRVPELEVDGEMQADAALNQNIRDENLDSSRLKGSANLLIMPSVDAANIAHNLLKILGGGVSIGPMLLGAARAAHVVSQSTTVRGLVNMIAVASSQSREETGEMQD